MQSILCAVIHSLRLHLSDQDQTTENYSLFNIQKLCA
jgi:hypothetical protein